MRLKRPFGGRTLEERIAERQAGLPPLKEGRTFEHAPAKFIFIALLVMIVLGHLLVLILFVVR
ncbi:MAG: hypothetical protein JWO67_2457 [Streptosporangiaceae bacterium]|jgi:hypothetical protein|nr:hypothetical protein [Streptosporangiaceae bacterium]